MERREISDESSGSRFRLPPGVFRNIAVVLLVAISALVYGAVRPPSPIICGSPGGPPITAPRIKLKDGRYLAYKEHGVPKDEAKYKIVFIHGYQSCRHDALPVSKEVADEVGIYLLSFDRPGYGESDPNPKRTAKGIALDVEELADQLKLGPRFYVNGFSMGGQAVWGCLKYIPHRLAGAALLAPVANYWWPGFPANISNEAFSMHRDPWTLRVAHHIPWLTYWWNSQKWFSACSVAEGNPKVFSRTDLELLQTKLIPQRDAYKDQIKPQGDHETLHRDLMVGFGKWEFDPLELGNPFPDGEASVHLWHGEEDAMVPAMMSRYIAKKLPWIVYHELAGVGHMFPYADGMGDAIVKSLVLGDQQRFK